MSPQRNVWKERTVIVRDVSSSHTFLGLPTTCRKQTAYSADVRIASDAASSNPSEALAFGTFTSANKFQTHANLSTTANGSLAISAADISMLPSHATASVGLGELHTELPPKKEASHMCASESFSNPSGLLIRLGLQRLHFPFGS